MGTKMFFSIYLLMSLIRLKKSNPHFIKGLLVMKLLVLLCSPILDSPFADSCHKLGNIGKHLCALLATDTLCPKFYKL